MLTWLSFKLHKCLTCTDLRTPMTCLFVACQVHASGCDLGPAWLTAWRAAATPLVPHIPASDVSAVLYAHGCMVACMARMTCAPPSQAQPLITALAATANRSSTTPASAAQHQLATTAGSRRSSAEGTYDANCSGAAGAAGSTPAVQGVPAAIGPRLARKMLTSAPAGEVAPFLAAAATRMKQLLGARAQPKLNFDGSPTHCQVQCKVDGAAGVSPVRHGDGGAGESSLSQ